MLLGGFYDITWAEKADSTEVTIEAAGSVAYDMESKSTTAYQDVVLRKGDIIIECQELIYNGNSGAIQASGDVKITTDQFVYQTQTFNYNLNEEIGNLAEFEGKIKEGGRDYYFSGNSGTLAGDTGSLFKAKMTSCPKPKPDYVLTAKRIDYDSERVYLRRVILKVKGVPVFYFPRLSFRTDKDLPDVRLDYDSDDGLQLSFDCAGPVKNDHSWHYQGEFSTKGSNVIGLGLKYYLNDNLSNRVNLAYNFDGFWRLSDYINYNTRLANLSIDGYKEFTDAEKTEVGIRLTRKYWETPVGRMQVSLLARDVFAFDSGKQEYGGTYWGTQLDYNPSRYVVLSYLRLDSEETNEDYRDFLEGYKLGDNYLYNINIPLSPKYTLIFDGNYNPDWKGNWINRFYRIKYETCCFRLMAGWDDIGNSLEFSGRIKF